jgi:hypothetical protein
LKSVAGVYSITRRRKKAKTRNKHRHAHCAATHLVLFIPPFLWSKNRSSTPIPHSRCLLFGQRGNKPLPKVYDRCISRPRVGMRWIRVVAPSTCRDRAIHCSFMFLIGTRIAKGGSFGGRSPQIRNPAGLIGLCRHSMSPPPAPWNEARLERMGRRLLRNGHRFAERSLSRKLGSMYEHSLGNRI